MGPLLALVQVLVTIVKHVASQGEPTWVVALPQYDEGLGTNELVNISDDDDIPVYGCLRAVQLGEDLLVHSIALEVLPRPGRVRSLGVEALGDNQLVVDDLVAVGGKAVHVLLDDQGLVPVGEGLLGLDYDEVVDVVVGGVEADLEPVQLGVDHDEVVDLAALGPLEGRPPMLAAELALDRRVRRVDLQVELQHPALGGPVRPTGVQQPE